MPGPRKRGAREHGQAAMPDDSATLRSLSLPVDPSSRSSLFLQGPAGAGKTTLAVARLLALLAAGAPERQILVLLPQRTLAGPYQRALSDADAPAGGLVSISTLGGLAQHLIGLFWPLIARAAGFAAPERPPTFLTVETAQYYMARLVGPLLEQGYFQGLAISRVRLYSQVLDNLNKAAVTGLDHSEIGSRLRSAWAGREAQGFVYDQAQECASRFRAYCLEHNLLDYSLQIETFSRHLWPQPFCRNYVLESYRHLIADNIEEDTPAAHAFVRDLLPHLETALLIYDQEAGYRRFLGADPASAQALSAACTQVVTLSSSRVMSPAVAAFGAGLARSLLGPRWQGHHADLESDPRQAIAVEEQRYLPQLLDWAADQAAALVTEQGVAPEQIVILAPYVSDALRFALISRLEGRGLPCRSHRPSRLLRDEPAARCLITLACLAHPSWGTRPPAQDVAQALSLAIEGLDPARAQLLAAIVYRPSEEGFKLLSFDNIREESGARQRITFVAGAAYERLRSWLLAYQAEPPSELDHFLARLFGEVLSQPGYAFHHQRDLGAVAANLIESARKFRWAVRDAPAARTVAQEYIAMLQEGVVAAQYQRTWQPEREDAILVAPAHTFLMSNRPVDYQFWLDVGSRSWWERPFQPLTHPYVLSLSWPDGKQWTDADEFAMRQERLAHLALGLARRCRKRLYLGSVQFSDGGYDEHGPLQHAVQRLLRSLQAAGSAPVPGVEIAGA